MLVYHEDLYHTMNHKASTAAQMNLTEDEKNIYHNISNQPSIEETVQKEDDAENEINFDENTIEAANFVVINPEPVSLKTCHKCQTEFNIRNQLHCHIKQCDEKLKIEVYLAISEKIKLSLIISSVSQVCKDEFSLQEWYYAVLKASAVETEKLFKLCIDTECSLKLIVKSFLAEQYLIAEVHETERKIQVCEIETKIHSSFSYVIIDLYIPGKIDDTSFREKITWEFHIVPDLKTNMLLKTDSLVSEKAIIDLAVCHLILGSCQNLKASLQVTIYHLTAAVVNLPKNERSASSRIEGKAVTEWFWKRDALRN